MLNERLSAWCDGELDRDEEEAVVAALMRDEKLCSGSHSAWLIGDVLRNEPELSADFCDRVRLALEKEPVVLVPVAVQEKKRQRRPFQWMSMAAGGAGVLVAGWVVHAVWSSGLPGGPLKKGGEVVRVQQGGVLASDRAYLMAHQASTGGVPMADVAHFIRTVSDDDQQGEAE